MIPLVVRSNFSIMRGVTSIPKLCKTARSMGYRKLALTDTNGLYGLWVFVRACIRTGLIPIIGTELTEPNGAGRAFLLAENQTGYVNLCRLITARHMDKTFDLASSIINSSDGLTIMTDSENLLLRLADQGLRPVAALCRRPDGKSDKLRKMARGLSLESVAVPDSYFVNPADYELHRIVRAIDLNTSLSRLKDNELADPESYLAPPDEYRRRFAIWPETIEATEAIAEKIKLARPGNDIIMPPLPDKKLSSAAEELRQKAYSGARERYGGVLDDKITSRLEHELAIIEKKRFSSYFLVVQDIIKRSPRICGRGSGAASLVAYCLGITNVCPVKHNLYFERFINVDRKDPPDIDIDFAWDERDDVIGSVLEQYKGHAAMVCNHVSFQGKMAIREVAKVYGLPEREIKQMSRQFPWLTRPMESHTGMSPRLKALPDGAALDYPQPWPEILKLAKRLAGSPRCLSVHPGGVVITPELIDVYTPVQEATKGVPIIQWEKDGAEDGGLVKIDLLGNRSLGVIRDAIANVKANGRYFTEDRWEPEDDPATQRLVAKGLTMGCFYIESPAMRLLQQKAGTGDFEHLVVHSSIIRPAANDYIQEYLRRLKGGDWQPIHPLLKDILAETYGIMIYQEDVSKAAVALAGFSHADADGLRKVMTRKDKDIELIDYKDRFYRGANSKGVSREKIDEVWQMMLSFSGYSFCKPHSASYARVSFQAAYLKAHFPAEFMAAVVSNRGGFYSAFAYLSEARRLGVQILPPDVNYSEIAFKGKEQHIRVGLMAVKDLKHETARKITAERLIRPYTSFYDFLSRIKPDEKEIRTLINAGAFESINPGQKRADLLWQYARRKKAEGRPKASGRTLDMFSEADPVNPPEIPADNDIDRLRGQYDALGFLLTCHPIVLFKDRLAGRGLIKAFRLPDMVGKKVRLAGWLLTGKTVRTKKNDPMQFLTFEDETAIYETTFFPKAYARFCRILDWGHPYILGGLVEENYGAITLTVDYIETVPPLKKQRAA